MGAITTDAVRLNGTEVLFLLPQEILIDPAYGVRPYSEGSEEEARKIEELASAIESVGQLEAGIVVPRDLNGKEEYVLFSGARRRNAIALINDRRSARGTSLLKMRVTVDRTGGDIIKKAVIINLHRKNFSPMDLALIIERLETQHQWQDFKGDKACAAYLGVNVATVTQHKRFLTADSEIKDKLHRGVITAQSAFDLLNVKPEKRQQVIERAEEIELETNPDTPTREVTRTKVDAGGKKTSVTDVEPNHVKHPAIKQAIREQAEADDVTPPMSRKDIVEFFEQFDGPPYGHPNGAVRSFVRYFCDEFVLGKGTERTAIKKWDAMVAKADKGTAEKEVKAESKDKGAKKKAGKK